ncbi:hypothetical protein ACROYT_G043670 [Oculina patagonica]
MPPRCPKRSSVTTREGPPPKRTRRGSQTNGQRATAQQTTAAQPAVAGPGLPADLLEKIVSTVTMEVTKQLTPLLIPADRAAPPNPQLLDEVPAAQNDVIVAGVHPPPSLAAAAAAAVVSDSVNTVNTTLSGEVLPATTSTPLPSGPLFSSASLPIDAKVSPKLTAKIWLQEYIDFGSLLANPVLDNKFQLSLQTATEGKIPSLCFEPAARPKKIQTIDTWMHAFHIFTGIYTSKYPNEAPALVKYADVIQDLAARGHNWKYYDENFRFLRQSQASAYPWGEHFSFETSHLQSALEHPEVVDAKLKKELDAHRLAGPFHSPPFPVFHVSPIGVVPKKSPGEFRLIHHLSYPKETSINDGISSEHSSVHYATIQDAIRLIKLADPGCFLAKTDIKNAFRIIPINPSDYHLLGIKWNGQYFYDRCMPMGCASSCKTFETFSTAVEWIAREKLSIQNILHLLDDFLIVAPSKSLCHKQLDIFLSLCSYLGIPTAPEKTCGPSTILSFAGIELDTVQSQARLPQDKLLKCTQLISQFLHRMKVTLQELQSLIGLLNFACSVILPGRAFLRRLIDLTTGIRAAYHRIRLSGQAKDDLRVWLSFLSSFNGRSFFLDEIWHGSDKLNLFTDAAGSIGFGAVFANHWCCGKWPSDWLNKNIAFLEFYPIVLSLYLWGHLIQNRCILFFTDNEALVYIINKQSCRDRDLMFFVRKLVSVCLKYNILFKAKHVPGVCNKLADSLSRLQIHTFKQLAPPFMNPCPSEIPLHLQPQHWQL